MEAKEKDHLLFTQLVVMFHAATMQQLGKVQSSISGKIERDLVGAQGSIDILDMLREKTKGNLTADEERLINDLLRELKLNYVDEVNKNKKQKAEGEKTGREGTGDNREETKKEQ